jgi:hypothetical protein
MEDLKEKRIREVITILENEYGFWPDDANMWATFLVMSGMNTYDRGYLDEWVKRIQKGTAVSHMDSNCRKWFKEAAMEIRIS